MGHIRTAFFNIIEILVTHKKERYPSEYGNILIHLMFEGHCVFFLGF